MILLATLAAWPAAAQIRDADIAPSARAAAAGRSQAQKPAAARSDMARFAGRVGAVLSASGADKGYWGILIRDADSGETLYALHPERYFEPASNAKLFTTAMALATLGPRFRIQTTLETTGYLDRNGLLRGDLVLVGRGDANLSNRVLPYVKKDEREGPPEKVLAELADQVVARGVKQIDGDVVADEGYFDAGQYPSGWTVDDTVWSYGAPVSAITVNDNIVTLEVRPGETAGAPLEYDLEPRAGFYQVHNEGVTTAAGTEPQLRIARDPGSHVFELSGSLPRGAPPRRLDLAAADPAEYAAALLARLLEDRGVRVDGRSRSRQADSGTAKQPGAQATVLAEHISAPLAEDVEVTNKDSLNLHAELMLRVAAREKGQARTLDDALKFAEQFRQQIGLAPEDVKLSDGSGLSTNDLVTPRAVVELLAWCARQPWSTIFRASLPVAGEDGTLEDRMKGTPAAGRVHAKTGQLNHVVALSGYATSVRGEHLIFSMFGNNNGTGGHDATAVLDALCADMVETLGPAREARHAAGAATEKESGTGARRQISR